MGRDLFGHDIGGEVHVQRLWLGQTSGAGRIAQPQKPFVQFDRVDLAQKGQVAAAPGNQAFARQPPAQPVVDADRALGRAGPVAAPHHHRAIAFGHLLDRVVLVGLADQQDTVQHAGIDNPFQPVIRIGDHAAEHDVIAVFRQGIGQMPQDGHEERVGQVLALFMPQRHDHADYPGFLHAQPARHLVGAKAMLPRQRLDAFPCVLVHQRLAGQRTRNRAGGNASQAGQFGNVADPSGGR